MPSALQIDDERQLLEQLVVVAAQGVKQAHGSEQGHLGDEADAEGQCNRQQDQAQPTVALALLGCHVVISR
jgi:hypothetical protein